MTATGTSNLKIDRINIGLILLKFKSQRTYHMFLHVIYVCDIYARVLV